MNHQGLEFPVEDTTIFKDPQETFQENGYLPFDHGDYCRQNRNGQPGTHPQSPKKKPLQAFTGHRLHTNLIEDSYCDQEKPICINLDRKSIFFFCLKVLFLVAEPTQLTTSLNPQLRRQENEEQKRNPSENRKRKSTFL